MIELPTRFRGDTQEEVTHSKWKGRRVRNSTQKLHRGEALPVTKTLVVFFQIGGGVNAIPGRGASRNKGVKEWNVTYLGSHWCFIKPGGRL